jgi:lipid-binding SYLF domain-containing protein
LITRARDFTHSHSRTFGIEHVKESAMTIRPYLLATILGTLACTAKSPRDAATADATERQRALDDLDSAATALRELERADFINPAARARARCVAILPATVRGGLLVSAHRGHGVVACRTPNGWSGPAFVTLTGGGAGVQVGYESADLVMLFNSERAVSQLHRSSFDLGADASVAAGPVGREAQASTDPSLTAEIVTYARSRGAFVGAELRGSSMAWNEDEGRALYGRIYDTRSVLVGEVPAGKDALQLVDELRRAFPDHAGARASR